MPPHHLGLWNEKSLLSLPKFYNLRVEKVCFEPLNTYEWYYKLQIQRLLNLLEGNEIAKKITRKVSRIMLKPSLKLIENARYFIPGHSMLTVYIKTK